MGFQLTITAGLGQGKSFTFDQQETRLGRTSENDVVLFDPGVSRRHARIVDDGGAYRVEDLGSANGTKVNGALISGPTRLQGGDHIVLGPVDFVFELLEQAAAEPVGQETRIVARASLAPPAASAPPRPSRAAAPRVQAEEEEAEDAPEEPPASLRRPPERRPARPPPSKPALSAVERARLRRQVGSSLGGQLRYSWSQLPGGKRAAVLGAVGLVLLVTLGGLYLLFAPQGGGLGPGGPEPERLSLQPVEDSFGLGSGVRWTRPDMKVFDFEFAAPTRAVVVLHYRAQDISQGEVSVILNAVDQGFVPADVAAAPDREIEQVLSPKALKRNERNQLIFDNVKNPPGHDPWRVQGLWIEVVPMPEVSPAETLANAQEYTKRAAHFYDLRAVGPENLFRAWKSYRDAWLALESLDERPELYQTVLFQMNALKHQLDQQCAQLMLEAERSIQLNDPRRARQTLEEVPRYFPTREHRCHNLALQKMAEFDL